MVAVSRREFTQTLAQNGGQIHLDRMSPRLRSLFRQQGIQEADLSRVAGEDRVIRGDEFGALYDQLSARSPVARQGRIQRVQRIYEALQREVGQREAADEAAPPEPEAPPAVPAAGLRQEMRGRRPEQRPGSDTEATDGPAARPAQAEPEIEQGWDRREREIDGEDVLTHTVISPTVLTRIEELNALEAAPGDRVVPVAAYVDAMVAADSRAELESQGNRRAAAGIERPEGVPARIWNLTPALERWGISGSDAQYYMATGQLPDLVGEDGAVLMTGEQRMQDLERAAVGRGSWTAVNSFTFLVGMRRSALAAERSAIAQRRDELPEDAPMREEIDAALQASEALDRELRTGVQTIYRQATLARERRGQRLVARADRLDVDAAAARASGDTDRAEALETEAQSLRDRGAKIAHDEAEYRSRIRAFDASTTYQVAARAQIDTGRAKVRAMQRGDVALTEAPPAELGDGDGTTTANGIPGAGHLLASAREANPSTAGGHRQLSLESARQGALAVFHDTHVRRSGYLDRVEGDGTLPDVRSAAAGEHRQAYFDARVEQARSIGERLGIYRASSDLSAEDQVDAGRLAAEHAGIVQELNGVLGTELATDRQLTDQRTAVHELEESAAGAEEGVSQAREQASAQREASEDARDAADAIFGDALKTSGEERRDDQAVEDADTAERVVGLQVPVAEAQRDAYQEQLADARDVERGLVVQHARDVADARRARSSLARILPERETRSTLRAYDATRRVADSSAREGAAYLDAAHARLREEEEPNQAVMTGIAHARLDLSQYWIGSAELDAQAVNGRHGATERLDTAADLAEWADSQRSLLESDSPARRALASRMISTRAALASANADYRPHTSRNQLRLAELTITDLGDDRDRVGAARADIGVAAVNSLVRHNVRFEEIMEAGNHRVGDDDELYAMAHDMLDRNDLPARADVEGGREMLQRVDRALDQVPEILRRSARQAENGMELAAAQTGAISRAEIAGAQATMSSVITGPVWALTGGYVDMKGSVADLFEEGASNHIQVVRNSTEELVNGAADLSAGFERARANGQAFRYVNSLRILSVRDGPADQETYFAARDYVKSQFPEGRADSRDWAMYGAFAMQNERSPNPLATSLRGSILGFEQAVETLGDEDMAVLTEGQRFMLNTSQQSLESTTDGIEWIIGINTLGEVGLGIILTGGLGSGAAIAKGGQSLNAARTGLQAINTARTVGNLARVSRAVAAFRQSHAVLHTIGVTTLVGGGMMGANYLVGEAAGRNTGFARGFETFTNFIPIGVGQRAIGLGSAGRRAQTIGTEVGRFAGLRQAFSWGAIRQGLSWSRVAAHARFYGPQFAIGGSQAVLTVAAVPAAAEALGLERNELAQQAMGLFLNVFTTAGVAGGMSIASRRVRSTTAANHLVHGITAGREQPLPQSTRARMERAAFARIDRFQRATEGRVPTSEQLGRLRADLAADLGVDASTPRGAQELAFLDGTVESMRVARAAELGLAESIAERRGPAVSPEELSPRNPPDQEMVHRAVDLAADRLYESRGGAAAGASRAQAYRDAALHLSQTFDGHARAVLEQDGLTPYAQQLLDARGHAGDRATAVEMSTRLTAPRGDQAPLVAPRAQARVEGYLSAELGRARAQLDAEDHPNMRAYWQTVEQTLTGELNLTPEAAASTTRLMQAEIYREGVIRNVGARQLANQDAPLTNAQIADAARETARRMGYEGDAVEILARDAVQLRPDLEQGGFIRSGGETAAERAFRTFRAEHRDAADRLLRIPPEQFVETFGAEPDSARLAALTEVDAFVELVSSDPARARALVDAPPNLDVARVAQQHGIAAAELYAESPAALGALLRVDGPEATRRALDTDPAAARARATALTTEYRQAVDPSGRLDLEILDGARSSDLLSRAQLQEQIDPDLQLDAAQLAALGVEPRYAVTVDGVRMGLSEPFDLGHGRRGMVAFVEHDGEVHARIFYRSNSQAMWRVSDASDNGHYGKGVGEVDTQLPMDVTVAAHRMAEEGHIQVGGAAQAERIFRGLVVDADDDAGITRLGRRYHSTAYAEGRSGVGVGSANGRLATPVPSRTIEAPDSMQLPPPEQLPDFTQPPEAEVTFHSSAYEGVTGDGTLTGRVYPSRDGTLRYMVLEDAHGRVAIGGAELVGSEVTAWGNRREWVDLHGMDAPLYEYGLQMSRAHGADRTTDYRLNWSYTSETPLVGEYFRQRGVQPPPALVESPNRAPEALRPAIEAIPGTHNQRVLNALVSEHVDLGLPPEVQRQGREQLARFLGHNGEEGARFVLDMAQHAGSDAVVRLFARNPARQIDRVRRHATPEVMQGWREAPAAERADRVLADFGRFENMPPTPALRPSARHYLTQVMSNRRRNIRQQNTVVEPRVDVDADMQAINEGRARREGSDYHVNGRIYRLEPSGRAIPVSGDGLHPMDARQYRALIVYNEHGGDTPAARAILDAQRDISAADRDYALSVWRRGGRGTTSPR